MGSFYRLFIDESGDHTYGKAILQKFILRVGSDQIPLDFNDYPEIKHFSKRYLGLTGCFIEVDYYQNNFLPALGALKRKHFGNEEVILHRKEIINRKGPFWRLRDPGKEKEFNEDILTFLKEKDYRVITVVLDKLSHIERYEKRLFTRITIVLMLCLSGIVVF